MTINTIFSVKSISTKSFALVAILSLVLPVLVAPISVLAEEVAETTDVFATVTSATPNVGGPVSDCSIEVETNATTSQVAISLAGIAGCLDANGNNLNQAGIFINWDVDADPDNYEEVTYDPTEDGDGFTGDWSGSHDYGTFALYNVAIKLCHSDCHGHDNGDANITLDDILSFGDNGGEEEDNDSDDDGINDDADNCPDIANPGQEDTDEDGIGDACDDDNNTDPGTFGLSGYKWNDANANGVWDDGELGLAGWVINLAKKNQDTYVQFDATTTDANGYYSFIQLHEGFYSLSELLQNGWVQSYPDDCDGSLCSYLDLDLNDNNPDIDDLNFGNYLSDDEEGNEDTGFIQGLKYRDVNLNNRYDEDQNPNHNDALADWGISLYDADWDLLDEMLTGSSTSHTDEDYNDNLHLADNQYRFNQLAAGTYYVCEENRSGWTQITPRDGVIDRRIGENSDNITTVVDPENEVNYCYKIELAAGQKEKFARFGNLETNLIDNSKAYIEGGKYYDVNENGTLDKPEQDDEANLLNDWVINLFDTNWKLLDSMKTGDEDSHTNSAYDYLPLVKGQYRFGNLNAGTYYVCEADRAGWTQISPSVTVTEKQLKNKDGIASVIDPNNAGQYCYQVDLVAGENRNVIRFGNIGEDVVVPGPTNTAPVIEILGNNPFSLIVGNVYIDQNASSTDAEDGDLTSQIATSTNLNINTIGTYEYVYSVTDSDAATTHATRTINVIANNDNNNGGNDDDNNQRGGGGGSGGCRPCYPCDHIRLNCNDNTATIFPPADNGNNQDNFGQGGAEGGLAFVTAGDLEANAVAIANQATNTATTTDSATTTDNTNLAAVGILGNLLGIKWWWWILILILLGIIGYYTFRDKETN